MKHTGVGGASIAIVTIVAVAVPVLAFAQTTTEASGSPPPASTADVMLDADVHVRSIRFDVVPKASHITVTGVNQTGGSTVVRTNLPKNPQAGKTYTNVRVQLHAASRFVDPHGSPLPSASPLPR